PRGAEQKPHSTRNQAGCGQFCRGARAIRRPGTSVLSSEGDPASRDVCLSGEGEADPATGDVSFTGRKRPSVSPAHGSVFAPALSRRSAAGVEMQTDGGPADDRAQLDEVAELID